VTAEMPRDDAPTEGMSWAHWLAGRMARMGYSGNSDLARASGVPDSVISRWRTSGTRPALDQLRRLTGPLQASMLELVVAAGHLSAAEASLRDVPSPDVRPRDVRQAVQLDPVLTDDLKEILLLQYDAMISVARARATDGPPTA
jgi:transcriptional regulator with XRE-family HTH domain